MKAKKIKMSLFMCVGTKQKWIFLERLGNDMLDEE